MPIYCYMKKLTVVILTVMILSLTGTVQAAGPAKKLGRGVSNVITSPLELLKGVQDTIASNGMLAGVTWGPIKGAANFLKRAVVGVYEIVTFTIPMPRDYKPILKEPEFFMQEDSIL